MLKWNILHDMDDEETGKPTCWSLEINSEKYGKYVWITLNRQGNYDVEVDRFGDIESIKTCKTLKSAKSWVTSNILR